MNAGLLPPLTQLLLALTGFACLALSMDRHARQAGLRNKHSGRRNGFRIAGGALLAITLLVAVIDAGWGFGLVWVFAVLTLAALLVIGLLTYRPGLLMAAATGSGLAGGVLLSLLLVG